MMTLSQEEKGLPQKISDDPETGFPMNPSSPPVLAQAEVLSGKP